LLFIALASMNTICHEKALFCSSFLLESWEVLSDHSWPHSPMTDDHHDEEHTEAALKNAGAGVLLASDQGSSHFISTGAHQWKLHSFTSMTECCYCNETLWGITKQGFKCEGICSLSSFTTVHVWVLLYAALCYFCTNMEYRPLIALFGLQYATLRFTSDALV
jgi:hypothetical protein